MSSPSPLRAVLMAVLALFVASCGLKIPDPRPYLQDCDTLPSPPQLTQGKSQIFFISSALRDCREGTLKLTGFRQLPETYGVAQYDTMPVGDGLLKADNYLQRNPKMWFTALKMRAHQAAAGGKLTVFIHGYNNSFDEALDMAASIAEAEAQNVPVVLIHWPSRASAASYTLDEASVEWAQHSIDEVLAQFTNIAEDVTVIAHSMGTRAAIRGVIALDRIDHAKPAHIRRIVLASGDVDRAQVLRSGGSADWILRDGYDRSLMIYASYRDKAIYLSRRAHGYDRLGSTNCEYDVSFTRRVDGKLGNCHLAPKRPGLNLVSTSSIEPVGSFEHRDFIESCHVKENLKAFLRDQSPRPFEKDTSPNGDLIVGSQIDMQADNPRKLCLSEAD